MSIQDVINANREKNGVKVVVKSQVMPRQDYWGEKAAFEKTMQPVWDWGRARSDAAVIVEAALHSGALEFPKSASVSKRLGLLIDYLHEVTVALIAREEELRDGQ